jgi:hypothetical protein
MKLQTKSLSQEEETGRTHHIFPDLEEQAALEALAALLKRKNTKKNIDMERTGEKNPQKIA